MLPSKFLRPIASFVLLTFLSMVTLPLQAAVKMAQQAPAAQPAHHHDYGATLQDIKQLLTHRRLLRQRGQAVDDHALLRSLRAQETKLNSLDAGVEADFQATEQRIKNKHLPAVIMQRQQAAMALFAKRRAELKAKFQALDAADHQRNAAARQKALSDLTNFMDRYQKSRGHTYTDPHHLPFGSSHFKIRKPKLTHAQLMSSVLAPPLIVAGPIPLNTPIPSYSPLPATPTAADLAPTEDAPITPAIQSLAASLDHNPVKIYNWVHDNIQYIPSYGSIQGAALTLESRRGNDFDTASLLIALLRASNIPARYVYGTIQLPIKTVMNWVGGVTSPDAALRLLGGGGIPNTGLESGGSIQAVQMEHVWVTAYVDFVPSRGAVNLTPNTWVPMDASFKQYTFTPAMDIKDNVPFDAQALLNQLSASATINQTQGWVQNVDQAAVQNALTTYQAQVENYLSTTDPNATMGDVLGTQTIRTVPSNGLPGSLPYKLVAVGQSFDSVPDNFRWKYRTTIYANALNVGGDVEGTQLVTLTKDTVALAGKKITLSFAPATPADAAVIDSYLPAPHADGSPFQPSEFPTSLPGYLIGLTAALRVDGQLITQSAGSVTMGTQLVQTTAIFNPSSGQWEDGPPNQPIAGEYDAIALDLQGVTDGQVSALHTTLQTVQTDLTQLEQNPNNTSAVQYLLQNNVTGTILYTGALGYFASIDASDQLLAHVQNNIVTYRLPSYGAVILNAQPTYDYGIARSVSFPGVTVDMDRLLYDDAAKNANATARLAYLRQIGAADSAFEDMVPEQLFRDPSKPITDPSQPQGLSAVKLIDLAAAQGQKIYTLTSANASELANVNIGDGARTEIQNAIAAGLQVTVQESPITVGGWTGSGYIILDPATATGAYKISGGANGGFLSDTGVAFLTFIGLATGVPGLALSLTALAVISAVIALVLLFQSALAYYQSMNPDNKCQGPATVAFIALVVAPAFVGLVVASLPVFLIASWVSFMAGGAISGTLTNPNNPICRGTP